MENLTPNVSRNQILDKIDRRDYSDRLLALLM
jgi:hypothetical protein